MNIEHLCLKMRRERLNNEIYIKWITADVTSQFYLCDKNSDENNVVFYLLVLLTLILDFNQELLL